MRTAFRFVLLSCVVALFCAPALAQQTGSIFGQVTLPDGEPLPGVLVEATSEVLPRARTTSTIGNGEYRLPALPPGQYRVTFSVEGLETQTRQVMVRLDEEFAVDVVMTPEAVEEEIEVIGEAPLIDPTSAEIKTALAEETIDSVPLGQEYRDIQKLIPGVQYTEDEVRGPSAGGSGQDNVYQFDGVMVTLPLFGVLSAEPSNHDIEQVSIVKGGAKAVDFNRSGGFTIDTVSKSGTSAYRGMASYQLQSDGMTGDLDTPSATEFDEDRDWATANIGGPILEENLFFYASYYRPTIDRDNRANVYGPVPDFDSERDELFGKLTFTPIDSLLIHGSYRDSDRESENAGVGSFSAASTSEGEEATLEIGIVEGSWVVNDRSYVSFKYSDFANETSSRPDTRFGFPIAIDGSVGLDVDNLDRQGLFLVPTPIDGEPAYNDFIQPLINRFGFVDNGVLQGGGQVGGASTINNQDFFRESFQVGYDYLLGDKITHELHVGYQWYRDEEDLDRLSNGWGVISVPGGRLESLNDQFGQPVFYQARFLQTSLAAIPPIHSEFESQNIEINDEIRWKNWSFNLGVLLSNDELYGQGLRPNSANVSGFELAPGHKYKMYEIDFDEQIQPRLGAVWAYNGRDTVFANWSRYHPAASSLPRAASWDRNLARAIDAYFDADGNFIGADPVRSSSGKFFQQDLDPRKIDEYFVGTARRLTDRLTGRVQARYRRADDFWEDTNNDARLRFNPPPGIPQELYIPELDDFRDEVGGSSYVIAQLDNAFTKYYEVSFHGDWRGRKTFLTGSYVWSHYYGNFDQDNTTTDNDQAIFIGSSFIADGAGRQLWNFREGDLRGDRRNQVKIYGYRQLPWNATVGAFAVYQDGEPWEAWNVEIYRCLEPLGPDTTNCEIPGTGSTSSTSRFAEPAGSRRTDDHYQIDLNYTQDFPFADRYNVQLRFDLFNAFDNQTGYNVQPKVPEAGFGEPRSFYRPRRLQAALKFEF